MTTPTLITRSIRWGARRPGAMLALGLLLLLPLLVAAAGLRPDNSLDVWFVRDDPALVAYRGFLRTFGSDEGIVVAYRAVGWDATERALQERLVERLEAVDGLDGIIAASRVPDAVPSADSLRTAMGVRSADGRVLAVIAAMDASQDADAIRGRVVDEVIAAAHDVLGAAGREPHLAGTGVLYEGLNRQTLRDSGVFLMVSVLLMVVLLRVTLGRWTSVLVAMGPAMVASFAALGILALAGRPMTMVTAALPTLVLVIALSDAIHLIAHVERKWATAGLDGIAWRATVAEGVAHLAVPCFHTALTTAIGFAALATSQLAVVRDFGVFAAAGLLLAWAITLAGLVAGLVWQGPPPRPHDAGTAHRARPPVPVGGRFVERVVGVVARNRGRTLVGWALIVAVLAHGVARIRVDTLTIGLLPPGHTVRVDSDWIESHLGAYTPLEFVVRRDDARPLGTTDAATVVEWRSSLATGARALRTVGWPTAGARYLNADGTAARVTTFVPMQSARGFDSTIRSLRADADGAFASGPGGADAARLRAEPAGYFPLYVRIIDYVVLGTISGLAGSVVLVMLVFAWLLRSVRAVLAALLVNLLPVLLVFGIMGWAGIPLDIATATVGAIVLGIAVDDTIHFFFRLGEATRSGLVGVAALTATGRDVGHPMLVTTLVLSLGFGVMMLSGSASVASFGFVAMLSIAGAVLADIGLLPVLLVVDGARSAREARPS